MSKSIKRLPAAQLLAGMIVAEPVADEGGRVLLPAGTALTASQVDGLVRRGVTSVAVTVIESAADPGERALRQERIRQQLDRLFRQAGNGQETRTLQATVLAYSLEFRP